MLHTYARELWNSSWMELQVVIVGGQHLVVMLRKCVFQGWVILRGRPLLWCVRRLLSNAWLIVVGPIDAVLHSKQHSAHYLQAENVAHVHFNLKIWTTPCTTSSTPVMPPILGQSI